jgi:tetratricopeptide (TPR) repeat protein
VKDPLTPEEHINLGVAYEKKGELDNALREYKKAVRKLPLAYFYMGNIHFQKKEFNKAERSYKKSIKKNPQHADSYNNLAWLYYSTQRNLEEAEELARTAKALDPEKSHLYEDTLRKIIDLKKSQERKQGNQ